MSLKTATATAFAAVFLLSTSAQAQTTQADQSTAAQQSTTGQATEPAAQVIREDDNDMDWSWIGLLGLFGLVGLTRRRDVGVTSRDEPIASNTTRSGTGRL